MNTILIHTFYTIRKSLNFFLFVCDQILGRTNNTFVLCYHSIDIDDWRFSIAPAMLKKQILSLKRDGYSFITLDDLAQSFHAKKFLSPKSVVITIDDGYKNIVSIVSFFKKENILPALFVLSDPDNANRKELANTKAFLSRDEICSLIKKGWIIGSHSVTHANLTTLTPLQLTEEVHSAKTELEKMIGKEISYFAYPRGKYDNQSEEMVKSAGYTMALTMDDEILHEQQNVFRVPRIGVDRTHGLWEFKTLSSPSVIAMRRIIKESMIGRYI